MNKINLSDVSFDCPYCGLKNEWVNHEGSRGINRELIYCDDENGGCGKQMVLETHIEVKSKLIAFTIPSELKK